MRILRLNCERAVHLPGSPDIRNHLNSERDGVDFSAGEFGVTMSKGKAQVLIPWANIIDVQGELEERAKR